MGDGCAMCREKAGSVGQVVGPVICKDGFLAWNSANLLCIVLCIENGGSLFFVLRLQEEVKERGIQQTTTTTTTTSDGNGLVLVIDLRQDCITR
jgi:hypothetical protein